MCITSEECSWCSGSGVDSEGIDNGSYYACVDCRGTGFLHYEAGKGKYYEELNCSLATIENQLILDVEEQIRLDIDSLKTKKVVNHIE